jgi:NAD(P)-dependent dehydrogenase (short-subunit alcohol dehydrogenase family)
MARVLVTGSADGLGQAAAGDLVGEGHEVVVHARSAERLASVETIMGAAPWPSSVTCPTSTRRARWPIRSIGSAAWTR